MGQRTLIILGHPSSASFCAACARTWDEFGRSVGLETRLLDLGNLSFSPHLLHGYRNQQPLEPDLRTAQDLIHWAEHLVWVYPVWWGSIPALLKGFLDRVLLPGFAFAYDPGKLRPRQLLQGKTAELLVTLDTPAWYFKWVQRAPAVHQMRTATLEFCGIKTVHVELIGPIHGSTESRRKAWLDQVQTRIRRFAAG